MPGQVTIDAAAIEAFATAIFAHTAPGNYASLRCFRENGSGPWASVSSTLIGDGLEGLMKAATEVAGFAAREVEATVFCPPVATFSDRTKATEKHLAEGPALSVECDKHPIAAMRMLESLLGPATVIVASGGTWTNPETGAIEPKQHGHWRLITPASGSDLKLLKEARRLATALVGGDASNVPISHPLRWPGSLWRKQEPARLCRIVTLNMSREIDLGEALAILRAAPADAATPMPGNGSDQHRDAGEGVDIGELVRNILAGEQLHDSTLRLVASYLAGGMQPSAAVRTLRGLMQQTAEDKRDARWQARFDDIPRLVAGAHEKFGNPFAAPLPPGWNGTDEPAAQNFPPFTHFAQQGGNKDDEPEWSLLEGVRADGLPDFPLDALAGGWPDFLLRSAAGAGVTTGHVAVPLLAVAASLIGTARRVRASRSWSEPLTEWGATIGASGTGKTPAIDVSKRALARIEHERRDRLAHLQRAHMTKVESAKAALKEWKKAVAEAVEAGRSPPAMPKEAQEPESFVAPRLWVSDATVERHSMLLQARPRGTLVVLDELAGLFLNMGRYSNGSDREFWLEAFMGKPHVVERLGRPPVAIDHLLIGLCGGLQPDKLARAFEGDHDGLYARVLFCWPDEPQHRPLTDETQEVEPGFQSALELLIDLPAEEDGVFRPRYVFLSAKAGSEFENFRAFHAANRPPGEDRAREWWGKGPTHVLRLAGTLCFLQWAGECCLEGQPLQPEPREVDASHIAGAITLWREYFWPHAQAALRLIGLDDEHVDERRVLHWLRSTRPAEVSREDIRRKALSQRLDAKATQKIIDALTRANFLRERVTPTGGRFARRWEVNPKLYSMEG